jgi:transcriptional regulator with XRE-family HTH domain
MEAVMVTDMGKMLKKLMVDADISQNQLAVDLGISPSILSNYITGKNVPEMEVIGKLIERFNLEGEDLKEIVSKTLASTARHNHKISIDTRFFRPGRIDMLVKMITVLLMYPDNVWTKYDLPNMSLSRIEKIQEIIEIWFQQLDAMRILEYGQHEDPLTDSDGNRQGTDFTT